jgi:ClpA/ClpB-like protein
MELNILVEEVERRAASDEPLARLVTAVEVHEELTAQSDALLDHFIQQARGAGCSWRQIGDTLGVSKQAAQQRHGDGLRSFLRGRRGQGRLFQRFTPRARHVVVEAQEEARNLGDEAIGTEHVLLALYSEPDGIAARVLADGGLGRDDVVAAIAEWVGEEREPSEVKGHIPFTSGAKEGLEMALREAIDLGHNYIGTEHLLLAMFRVDGDDLASQILLARGLTLADTRSAVLTLLGQHPKG